MCGPARLLALGACALALASQPRLARAQSPPVPAPVECRRDFGAQVAEAIWLRDEDARGEAPVAPVRGRELDARTRFSLAELIGDLLLLREESGTTTWPPALSRLSIQELRERRDHPELDATACEIVRFMRDHYSEERSAERGRDRTAVAKRASAPLPPASPPPRPRAPAVTPVPEIAPSRVVPPTPVVSPPPVLGPPPRPAPEPAPPTVSASRTARSAPAPTGERGAPAPEPAPVAGEITRLPGPELSPRTAPVLTDQDTPAPPSAVAPPEATSRADEPEERTEPDPVALAPVEPAEPPTAAQTPAPAPASAAAGDLETLEATLAAPDYLTLRDLRRSGGSRPDEEVRRSRRQTLAAREELLRELRSLAAEPARLGALKSLLGGKRCRQVQQRIQELYAEGPDSDRVELALELWGRQPNPD